MNTSLEGKILTRLCQSCLDNFQDNRYFIGGFLKTSQKINEKQRSKLCLYKV